MNSAEVGEGWVMGCEERVMSRMAVSSGLCTWTREG